MSRPSVLPPSACPAPSGCDDGRRRRRGICPAFSRLLVLTCLYAWRYPFSPATSITFTSSDSRGARLRSSTPSSEAGPAVLRNKPKGRSAHLFYFLSLDDAWLGAHCLRWTFRLGRDSGRREREQQAWETGAGAWPWTCCVQAGPGASALPSDLDLARVPTLGTWPLGPDSTLISACVCACVCVAVLVLIDCYCPLCEYL